LTPASTILPFFQEIASSREALHAKTPLGCHCERGEAISRRFMKGASALTWILGAALLSVSLLTASGPAWAQAAVPCGPFTPDVLAAPEPREARWPVQRFEKIKAAVRTIRHRVLFLGDSITERFETDAPEVWRAHMAPRGVLNAGVSGDRTEHLLWRLQHGNLAGPMPAALVVLIGTNDLTNGGNGRPPEVVAEGIRANLLYLRQHLPNTRILLLGLLPRSASPEARLRLGTVAVNRLIAACGDNSTIAYADIGGVLLDGEGQLPPALSPDRLHFSPQGYQRLVKPLDAQIDRLLAGR
jgi:lysophospholipase L1-like esterase